MNDTTHRGYRIRHNPLSGVWWVEKDGYRIVGCQSPADGRYLIDQLLDPRRDDGPGPASSPDARDVHSSER